MKNIKLRIVYLILGAALLLFALFMLAVNVGKKEMTSSARMCLMTQL